MNALMLFPLNRPELNCTGIQIFDLLPSSIEAALHLQLLDLNFLLNLVFCWGGGGGQGVLRGQSQHLAGRGCSKLRGGISKCLSMKCSHFWGVH